ANFHKIWLGHMLESLDMIGNQKIRVAMFIMENINKENELIMTYRVIAEKTNTSLQTVSETMKALQESNLLSKIRNGYRSEEHTSELQSRFDLVCRLLLEKKK